MDEDELSAIREIETKPGEQVVARTEVNWEQTRGYYVTPLEDGE